MAKIYITIFCILVFIGTIVYSTMAYKNVTIRNELIKNEVDILGYQKKMDENYKTSIQFVK